MSFGLPGTYKLIEMELHLNLFNWLMPKAQEVPLPFIDQENGRFELGVIAFTKIAIAWQ